MTERLHFHFSLSCIGEGNGNPLQCSCLENPRDRGAWWAAVHGVAQSWTRLKRLSNSSSSIPQTDLQIQCHPFQNISSFSFDPKIHMEYQGIQSSKNNLEKYQSWRTHNSWFQKLLQSYSNQDSVVMAWRWQYKLIETSWQYRNKPLY